MPKPERNALRVPDEAVEQLCEALLVLRDGEECRCFFRDLLTPQELSTLAQWLQVARMLCEGCTYDRIRAQIATSSCTITRVSTELQYGSGGYRMVLARLAQTDETEEKKE